MADVAAGSENVEAHQAGRLWQGADRSVVAYVRVDKTAVFTREHGNPETMGRPHVPFADTWLRICAYANPSRGLLAHGGSAASSGGRTARKVARSIKS
jgi:hypothetical protein